MLTIQPINAFNDNYIWAIINQDANQVILVDVGDASPVIDFLEKTGLELIEIWITHKHYDHVGGVKPLQLAYPNVKVIAHEHHGVVANVDVADDSQFQAWQYPVRVWHVAGHTDFHLAYLLTMDNQSHVFCGDTLFSGGCGRVFTGDMSAMFHSLQRLASLADDTLFYPAHEYTASNLKFGLHIEPDNQAMKTRLNQVLALNEQGKPSLPCHLLQEKQTNVFLRTSQQTVIESVMDRPPLDEQNDVNIFAQLRTMKDDF